MNLNELFFILTYIVSIVSSQFLECSIQEDCMASDSSCSNGFCQCPKDKIFSMDGSKCLDLSFGFDSPCVEDQQCGWLLGNHQCIDQKCRCALGWGFYMGKCIEQSAVKEKCPVSGQCFNGYDLLAMTCKNDVCECNDGYYLRGETDCRPISEKDEYCSLNSDCQFSNGVCQYSYCREIGRNYNNSLREPIKQTLKVFTTARIDKKCSSNDDCAEFENAMCQLNFGKCLCKRGYRYIADTNKCVAEIGTYSGCSQDTDCEFKYTRCIQGSCYCRKTYFTVDGNVACQKPMTHDNLFCNNKERCYVLGVNAVCKYGQCGCLTSDLPNDYVCREEGCQNDEDCTLQNGICLNKICQCSENFHVESDACLPDLGSPCDNSSMLCTIENASCQDQVCSCKENFLQNDKVCIPVSPTLNDTCEINQQCSISNSECTNNVCKCVSNYVERDGVCVLKMEMESRCSTTSQCHMFLGKNVVCRNGYCNCPVDMKPNAKKNDCESSSNTLSYSYFIAMLLLTFNFMSR